MCLLPPQIFARLALEAFAKPAKKPAGCPTKNIAWYNHEGYQNLLKFLKTLKHLKLYLPKGKITLDTGLKWVKEYGMMIKWHIMSHIATKFYKKCREF